jgi:hypothetical protein
MPAARFLTSDNFGAPGLYIRERVPEGVVAGDQVNDVAVAGVCVRGPVDTPVEVGSPARFTEVFGSRDAGAGGPIVGEVWKFFLNKPFGRVIVVRAAAAAAVKASFTLETAAGGGGTAVLRVDASSPGLWGNDVQVKVAAASDGVSTKFNLTVRYLGKQVVYQNLDINLTGADNTSLVLGNDVSNLVTLGKLANGRPVNHAPTVDGADADGFVNLGETVAAFTSVAGTDGTIADSDFTAANRAIDQIANFRGVGAAAVAGRSNAAVKAALLTKAAASNDRLFLVCPDASSTSAASAITEVGTLRDDRIVYCFNHPTTLDPQTAELITVEPHSFMASILSQSDADVHPGCVDAKAQTGGIRALTFENLDAAQYDSFDAAGVCALERHDTGGFVFVSGTTSDLTQSRRQIDARRTIDFLIRAIAQRLEDDVKKPNTLTRRIRSRAAVFSFLEGQSKQERYVNKLASGAVAAEVTNDASVNTSADQALGIQKMLVRAQLIPQNLVVQLIAEIGTTVTVTEVAA